MSSRLQQSIFILFSVFYDDIENPFCTELVKNVSDQCVQEILSGFFSLLILLSRGVMLLLIGLGARSKSYVWVYWSFFSL